MKLLSTVCHLASITPLYIRLSFYIDLKRINNHLLIINNYYSSIKYDSVDYWKVIKFEFIKMLQWKNIDLIQVNDKCSIMLSFSFFLFLLSLSLTVSLSLSLFLSVYLLQFIDITLYHLLLCPLAGNTAKGHWMWWRIMRRVYASLLEE